MRICVYCGSGAGHNPIYSIEATRLIESLARAGHSIVYGGANVGLMKKIADVALSNGAQVTGVIPEELVNKEVAHRGLSHLHVVKGMHERKQKMFDLSDAFIALPGGFGTLDELFEMITWKQLGRHTKPIYLFNTEGYYNHLIQFINQATDAGFIQTKYLQSEGTRFFLAVSSPEELLASLKSL